MEIEMEIEIDRGRDREDVVALLYLLCCIVL